MLRIEATARDELAAETAPPVPRLYRGDVFLAQPDDTPPWRIAGLWPAGGNVVLAAQFKAGKTTVRDNLIRSWCDGYSFLGRYPITPAAGHLVVIDAEMPARIARRWLNDQMITHTERFSYVNIRGAAASLNILAPATAAEWIRLMAGAGAVLVDCIGPVMAALGLDESKSADTGRFLAALERVLADASVPECFLIHHMGHGAERSRGASRLRDWPDAEWRLVRQDDRGTNRADGAAHVAAGAQRARDRRRAGRGTRAQHHPCRGESRRQSRGGDHEIRTEGRAAALPQVLSAPVRHPQPARFVCARPL